jgi:PAS domain S-box-containing protein
LDPDRDTEISEQLRTFAEQTADFVGVTDPWGRILYLNPAARKRLGVSEADELTAADIFPLEAFEFYYEVARPQLVRTGAWSGEVLVNVAGGGAVPMYVSATARIGPGGETNGNVLFAHDVHRVSPAPPPGKTDIDEETGVLQAAAFAAQVQRACAGVSGDGDSCALVVATAFEPGEPAESVDALATETVMRALAGRMARMARTIDVVGRVGEHHLGLILRGVRSPNQAMRLARAVYAALIDAPLTTPGEEITPSISCGVAFARPGDDAADLIHNATAAIWREPATRETASASHHSIGAGPDAYVTMDEFRLGLSHGDVRAYARPVAGLATGAVAGYEGILRWHHKRLGRLEASSFIAMIAESPLANQVDLYLARETAGVLTLRTRDRPLHFYTPISKRLVADAHTEQYLSEIADAFSLALDQMHLQLARRVIDGWSPTLDDALVALRAAGVVLALTGVERASDVADAVERGFGEVRLARRLAVAATHDQDARRTVTEISRRAREHGVPIVAAGVDDARIRDLFVEAGCDFGTGELYGELELSDTID